MERLFFVAEKEDAGKRVDVFLAENVTGLTRSRIKNMLEEGLVKVGGKTVTKSGYAIKYDDEVEIEIPDAKPLDAKAEDIPVEIVYEDDQLAVVNKAQGMVVHPANGNESGTLVNALLFRLDSLSGINGVARPGIVHRIDKDTSGLLVVAKTDEAHKNLAKQIAEKSAKRQYVALVDGNIKEDEGIVDKPIARSTQDRKKMAVQEGGRRAVTEWKVLERFGKYTLMEFNLQTGRTHQIRVHAKFLHHPVTGDPVYGGSNEFGLKGPLLHAYKLTFTHPTTGETMTFTAPLPDYFEKVLEKLRKTQK